MKKVLYLFGELNDDDLDWIVTQGAIERIPAGSVLIREGEPSSFLYIIFEGSVIVSVNVLGSSKEVASLGSGEVLGEMSFIDGYPPSATIETLEDSVVLSLSRLALTERLHQDIGFASRFYRAIALFLSSRLRVTLTELNLGQDSVSPDLELSPVLLEEIPLAQARFDWLLRRAQNAIHASQSS
ncbi:MAG: cyclic nucleotide-binding domain-containing protein [Woronichinia naegeliana WA131]|jgi:CRP-like cAMP-binding protein|uniref:Cyclic nucleotide-binding domain-containing protein n=1 Tax=Woronichinia naegeliana WA131 TaxID=2824559 RepID=A0A977L1P4_9CYAN|nr:MAG: cyclic nucleotide-binding domain-containing protein [Woronichinia naegeliana WA131]